LQIGHINLDKSMNGTGEHFVRLIEGLDRLGVNQHVIVRNRALARRLAIYENVTVGPTVTTAVTAYCLMPNVAVVHTHDETSGHAGLLLTLTRSIPYVATRRSALPPGRNPIIRSVYGRAVSLICPSDRAAAAVLDQGLAVPVDVIPNISHKDVDEDDEAAQRIAAEHLRVYRRAADSWRVPALLL
jgi:hypothetical protein